VRGLEQEYTGRIDFTFVNILKPENESIIKEFGFGTTPELYLLDSGGQVIGFWADEPTADDLRLAFDTALKE